MLDSMDPTAQRIPYGLRSVFGAFTFSGVVRIMCLILLQLLASPSYLGGNTEYYYESDISRFKRSRKYNIQPLMRIYKETRTMLALLPEVVATHTTSGMCGGGHSPISPFPGQGRANGSVVMACGLSYRLRRPCEERCEWQRSSAFCRAD
jgi:hypothetical protein